MISSLILTSLPRNSNNIIRYGKVLYIRRTAMRKYSIMYAFFALLVLLSFTTNGMCFAGAGDIKARMQERLPTIVKMKDSGIIGENNKGLLEFVPGAVSAENNDRRAVYNAIAKQQNTTATLVGERRAIQIAESATAGHWLQDDSGKWYKK
jgi:uncharacterized protein YdbL (DUF1318 family)